ncbi:unnamed protein product [Pylaiella littoralis]
MSLPRPGGRQGGGGEKKSASGGGGGSAYGSAYGSGSTPSAFAGYTPPSATPPTPYTPPAAAGSSVPSGPGPGGFSFGGAAAGVGGGGGGGGGGPFGPGGGAAPQGFGGGGTMAAGGALGGGGGVGGDARNQYGFSNAGGGVGGGGGLDALGTTMGAVAGSAMGMASGGSQQRGGGGGGQGQQHQQPLDWHQWTPDGMNAQMLNVGGSVASNFLKSNVAQYQPRMSGFWNTLKVYFTVDNRYVVNKLRVLLVAVVKKDWYRLPSEDEVKDDGRPKFERPLADVNAPDLYVPLMSFITFVLVTGYAKGSAAAQHDKAGTFSPETLTEVTSSCVVTQLLEVLLIRLGLYLLNSPAVVLDLVAYTGYKYVGLCINMTLGIYWGKTAYFLALLWTGFMMSFFMFKTMAHTVPTGSASREIMILGFAALQLLSMWWLGDSDDL